MHNIVWDFSIVLYSDIKPQRPLGETCGKRFVVLLRLEIACLSINSATVHNNLSSTIVFQLEPDEIN